jgi:hypothetical protein
MRHLNFFILEVVFVDRIITGHSDKSDKSAQIFDSAAKFSHVVFAWNVLAFLSMELKD